MNWRISATYLQELQAKYHKLEQRGICMDMERVKDAKTFIANETQTQLDIASKQWGISVFVGAANKPVSGNSININATQGASSLLVGMQNLGYKVPKITKKDLEGEYVSKESTSELALQKMLVTNQFNYAGGDPAIKAILSIREMGKLKSSYFGCNFYSAGGLNFYLSNYNCVGTLTGRRASRKHTYGYGNNAQNFPKHGSLAKVFRKCLVARPDNVFLMVDQKGAELWPVYSLANDRDSIQEMINGINKHIKRAAGVFNIPTQTRSEKEWKDSLEYYLGKKIGHALNYGMRGQRMADSLAQEGKSIPAKTCQQLLDIANNLEPKIDGVFHKYIIDTLNKTRVLVTPFGRERQFLGLRPNDSNYKIYNEAYAYIPQSTVGDNTGFAVYFLEDTLPPERRAIVQEGHDSIVQDIPFTLDSCWEYLQHTISSFDRPIRFHNGIEVNIPVEAELGFNFAETIKIPEPLTFDNLKIAFDKLAATKN